MGRILIVEDDPLMGQDISLKLQHFGYEVIAVVVSSEEAIAVAGEARPDLILMDILLEGDVDGIETAECISRQYRIPIVFLTAYDDAEFIRRASITEPYGYILKPFTGSELQAVVSIALYKSQIEKKVRQTAQVAATLSGMSDPVFRVDRAGVVVMCNPAAEQLLGCSQAETIDQPISGLLNLVRDGGDVNVLDGLLTAVLHRPDPVSVDRGLVLRRPGLPELPVSLKISEIQDEADDPGGAVLLLQDISSRAHLQAELNLLAQVFKTGSEGILITDPDMRILRVNDAYQRITGFTLDDVAGQQPVALSCGYHDDAFYQELRAELEETGSWTGEIWNRRKNGELFPELLNLSAVLDERGCITHYVGIFTDISASKHLQERLVYLRQNDELTGLPNRNMFEEQAKRAIDSGKKNGKSVAFMLVDIDNFNSVNEVFGHPFGDRLLTDFAGRIANIVQDNGLLMRFSGDTFALILEEDKGDARLADLADSLLEVLSIPFSADGKSVQLTVSIGISVYPVDGKEFYGLLKCVDNALHYAKRAGKNSYRFFDRAMYDSALAARRIEQALRSAIERQEFQLCYQPQIEIESGKVTGCEALIRWKNGDLGQVPPSRFIPIAEDTGQIVAIGKWVLREACKTYLNWVEAGPAPDHVAVNVSARQFRDPDFIDVVTSVLDETGMQTEHLMLEVTESVAMDQGEGAIRKLRELKSMGIQLSLDDFGTGYSALSSLQRYPFDTLKIDRSFILESQTSEQGRVLLEAIIRLGAGLQLETIAEGVEEEAQVDYLRRLGCRLIQGYYYSRPVPGDQVGALVQTGFTPFVE